MLSCPLCKKKLNGIEVKCPTCQADLSLLVGYVEDLAIGLAQAQALTRAGRLADAVFAYLQVLDVDPENAEARRQVGKIVAAVRNFDSAPRPRIRRNEGWSTTIWLLIVLAAALIGFAAGFQTERWFACHPAETTDSVD
jgi:hypothetical protein